MNEETTVTTATETTIPVVTDSAEATAPVESTAETIEETAETIPVVYDAEVQETETTALITVDQLHAVRDDLISVNLFGAFLICGAIVGCALCRRFL